MAELIGLISNRDKPDADEVVGGFWQACLDCGLEVTADRETAALAGRESDLTIAKVGEACSLLVVFGGDGTILNTLHHLQDGVKPIFGINIGSLGFLTSVSSSSWREAVECIREGRYELSLRTLLQCEVSQDDQTVIKRTGLNDVVVSRGKFSQLVQLRTKVDGGLLTVFNADGLVLATPTGSTAYSLSAGGPILVPGCGSLVLTPICPHVLTNRSAIISEESVVEIDAPKAGQDVHVAIDGMDLGRLADGAVIRIRRAHYQLPLATLPGITYFDVLRQKLKWSGTNI